MLVDIDVEGVEGLWMFRCKCIWCSKVHKHYFTVVVDCPEEGYTYGWVYCGVADRAGYWKLTD